MKSPSGDPQRDAQVVSGLRSLVASRAAPLQLLAFLHAELGGSTWISDSFYLRAAFHLSVEDVAELLGWRRYGGDLPDVECSDRLMRMIDRRRHEWQRSGP
jgi:hypothetical protein